MIIAGGIAVWKISSQPKIISDLMPLADLKVNGVDGPITVPFSASVNLIWESKEVDNCFISGDVPDSWYSPVGNSGSQSVGNIVKSTKYIFVCVDKDGKEVSDSVSVNIGEEAISSNGSLADLFKNFQYFWKKDFCSGLKNDPDVRALQTALFFEGILNSKEQITGNYDDATFQAVKKFQENYGIVPASGCVKSKTRAKLNELFYYFNYGEEPVVQEQRQEQKQGVAPKTTSIPAPIISFYADSDTVPYNGSTALNWSVSNAKSCAASGDWSGEKKLRGSEEIKNLVRSGVYTLICQGSGGSTRRFVFVNAGAAPATISFSANPATVSYGGSTMLTWSAANVKSCIASGDWFGPKAASGSEEVKNITYKKTYVLSCADEDGNTNESVVSVGFSYTYSWVGNAWGACSVPCGGGTQNRTISCKRSDGQIASQDKCPSSKIATSQACNTAACLVDDKNYSGVARHGEVALTAPCGYRKWQVLSVSRSPKPTLGESAIFGANSGEKEIFNDSCDNGSYLYLKYDSGACRLYHRARTDDDCGYGGDSWNYTVRFFQ